MVTGSADTSVKRSSRVCGGGRGDGRSSASTCSPRRYNNRDGVVNDRDLTGAPGWGGRGRSHGELHKPTCWLERKAGPFVDTNVQGLVMLEEAADGGSAG